MPLDLGPLAWGWLALVALGASFVRGYSGFGFAALLVSGLANGAAVGGLPVAAFFAAQPINAAAFRATLVAYFLLLDAWTLPVMWREGLLTSDTLLLAALGLPVMLLGLHLGSRHFLKAPPEEFRRFAIWTLMALAVLGLLRATL